MWYCRMKRCFYPDITHLCWEEQIFWQLLSGSCRFFFLECHNHDFRFAVWAVIERQYWHSFLHSLCQSICEPFNKYLFSTFFSGHDQFPFVYDNLPHKVEDYSKRICTFYNTMKTHYLKPIFVIKLPKFPHNASVSGFLLNGLRIILNSYVHLYSPT